MGNISKNCRKGQMVPRLCGEENIIRKCKRSCSRKKVTLCAKTNVLTYAHDLWERVFYEVAEEYPKIETDYEFNEITRLYNLDSSLCVDSILLSNP